jgi:hypothetical protein
MLVSCWNWLLRRCKSEVSRRDRCLLTKRAENSLNSVGDLADHTYKCLSVLITLRPCWFNSRNVWVRTSCRQSPVQGLQTPFSHSVQIFHMCGGMCVFLSVGKRIFCPPKRSDRLWPPPPAASYSSSTGVPSRW